MAIRKPDNSQHIVAAGMTGSGKTVAMLDMLADKDFRTHAAIIIDHKRDENILQLPAEPLNPNTHFLPKSGLHLVTADVGSDDSNIAIEGMLRKLFDKGNVTIYVDEGHLMPKNSSAIRNIMVAGRSKKVQMMWTSQRTHWIDTFIWSQASFMRCFTLQNAIDHKKFNEFFPRKYITPDKYHSYYFDVPENQMHYLAPSPPFEVTLDRFREKLVKNLRAI